MSNLKSTRGKLSQEQRDFLINNSEMPVAKLQTQFRKKFNRKISVNNLTNFYRRNMENNTPSFFDTNTEYAFGADRVSLRNSNGDEVIVDIALFTDEFVKNLADAKKFQIENEFENKLRFWGNIARW